MPVGLGCTSRWWPNVYANHSAIIFNLPVRVAKDWIGHSLDVPLKHYGNFIDAKDVASWLSSTHNNAVSTSLN